MNLSDTEYLVDAAVTLLLLMPFTFLLFVFLFYRRKSADSKIISGRTQKNNEKPSTFKRIQNAFNRKMDSIVLKMFRTFERR
jgi:hypothetical protein